MKPPSRLALFAFHLLNAPATLLALLVILLMSPIISPRAQWSLWRRGEYALVLLSPVLLVALICAAIGEWNDE